ncbi:hypothetical protein N665_4583s0001 [Sinapis alba]|nr:hypothetical protein N665_4583s0001 [Sinapis alba]
MDSLELPKRIFILEEEPFPIKSIAYHKDDSKLFCAVRDALHDDEYEELKESRLGVFLKFKEIDFGWESRLVHYMLCFQLNIKKKYELWSLVGADPVRFSLIEFEQLTGLNCEYIKHLENPRCEVTNEMASFWERIGVYVDAGPSSEQIIRALKRCQEWSRDDRMRLGYLAIFSGFIEGRKYSSATRASLARLVMDLERFENYPWGRVAFKVLMDSLRAKDFTKSYTVDGFIQVLQEARRLAKKDSALAAIRGRSERDRKLAPSQQSPFQGNSTAKLIIPNTKVGHGYDPFALPDKQLTKALMDHVKKDPNWRKSFDRKPKRCLSYWYQVIRTPLAWLMDTHMDAYINVLRLRQRNNPNHFRSERIYFLDHLFSRMWRDKYGEFKSSEPDHNGLGRRLPGGSWDLYAGIVPTFCASNKTWDVDIDEIYASVNFQNDHWIAIWISIPKRHIVV